MAPLHLVTGAGGQLGRALLAELAQRGVEARGLDHQELDVTDAAAVRRALQAHRPAWVFHCAAATKVDRCEREPDWAERLNAQAPGQVARACAEVGAGLVHYSTDFVFDGSKGAPYVEDDRQAPLSVYGQSKARGEAAVGGAGLQRLLIVRTQWVYGPGGRNFPAAILAKLRAGEALRVVGDQVGSPTLTLDLAAASLDLVARCTAGKAALGTYHAANRGALSWYQFARLVLDRTGHAGVSVTPIGSDELDLPARRPPYSVLDCRKLEAAIGRPMPDVAAGLDRWLAAEGLAAARLETS
jgi:dTDP-4-dehydrorhamnose reductase